MIKERKKIVRVVKKPYNTKNNRFKNIDGFDLSDDIPETQQAKINALKNKHWCLFEKKATQFERELRYYAPK